jgi:hypothetical protein
MMKKYLLLALLVLYVFTCKGQLMLAAGYSGWMVKYNTFDAFRTSFNDYNKATLKKEISPLKYMQGFNFDMQIVFHFLFYDFGYNRLSGNSESTYQNGDFRKFHFEFNHVNSAVGFGFCKKNGGGFFYFGMNGGRVNLRSIYNYGDGYPDMCYDKTVNGVYDVVALKWTVGVKILIPVTERIGGYMDLGYVTRGMFAGYDELLDWNAGKLDNDQMGMRNIPTDYSGYFSSGSSNYSGDYVRSDMKGLRFTFGLRVNLTKPADD